MRLFLLYILMKFPLVMANELPNSARFKAVNQKQQPLLERSLKQAGFHLGDEVFIRIFKKDSELELWVKKGDSFSLFKTYPICFYGFKGLGPKLEEGDGKAPEGFYFVKQNQLNPNSKFHLSFNLGYPNQYDRAHGRTGSALMVHGNCVSVGCYAMTDAKIEEIYTIVYHALANGQPFFRVHVFPFKMTQENLDKYKDSQWFSFWKNLKQGYDYFENNKHMPPNVEVKNNIYTFDKL